MGKVAASSELETIPAALSGGNQQKLMFARALLAHPTVLIADEPTRGVDVGAKRDIYELMVGLAASGVAILLISNEIEEVLGLAHRVLVMRGGRVSAELDGRAHHGGGDPRRILRPGRERGMTATTPDGRGGPAQPATPRPVDDPPRRDPDPVRRSPSSS